MINPQEKIVALFKEGKVPGESSIPKYIQTVISNVFIFPERVYKLYRNDNEFFNKNFRNLADTSARHVFTRNDFAWNQSLSPLIHERVVPVAVENGELRFSSSLDKAEEMVIVMRKVDTKQVLYDRLVRGDFTEGDALSVGKQLAKILRVAQTEIKEVNFAELFTERIKDYNEWIRSVPENIPHTETEQYRSFLENFTKDNQVYFEKTLSSLVTRDGDFQSCNEVYDKGVLSVMDTYPPKEEWGTGLRFFAFYRTASDIWGLTGRKEYFDAMKKGYEEESGFIIDSKLDTPMLMYASGIFVAYLYMLAKTDPTKAEPAKRYHGFLRKLLTETNKNPGA